MCISKFRFNISYILNCCLKKSLKIRKMDAAFNTLYKPIFFQEVPPLQNIVICKMIQYTWHNELSIQKLKGQDNLVTFLRQCKFLQVIIDLKCQKVKLLWNVPWKTTQMSRYIFEPAVYLSEQTKIQRNMELYAWNLTREFSEWVIFHGILIFCDYDSQSGISQSGVELLYSFNEFVYDVYGRIDYEKTAKNLLNCVELTPCRKFIIACMYCFEEKIEQLWPLEQAQLLELDNSKINQAQLIKYWINRKTDKLNPVLLRNDHSTIFRRYSTTYSAMKYFWKNIMTFDEKVNCIGECFVYENGLVCLECIKHWFPKMNDEFLKCVILRYGAIIMVRIIQTSLCRRFMLSFWQHTAYMFTGDQFVCILQGINAKKFRDLRLICRVLWFNAPTKLKIHVLNHYQIEDVFDPLNHLIQKIYAQNPFNIHQGILLIPSDWIYYPHGCECENTEEDDCKCETLLK